MKLITRQKISANTSSLKIALHVIVIFANSFLRTSILHLVVILGCNTKPRDILLSGVFKTTIYDETGLTIDSSFDTLALKPVLDLNFYNFHFQIPTTFPDKFIDMRHKDTSVIVWNDTAGDKNIHSNWTFTTYYDSLSRATSYTYSGCLICSQMPYYMKIDYIYGNRPIKLSKYNIIGTANFEKKDQVNRTPVDEYIVKYDANGNIIELIHISYGKLRLRIEAI